MSNEKLLVKCLKEHYRFDLNNDEVNYTLTLEDLFGLSLKQLDSVYADLDARLSSVDGKKTLSKKVNPLVDELKNKMSLVEMIYTIVEEEQELFNDSLVKNEQKQRLMKLISDKEEEALMDKSVDELKEMLNNL